MGDYKSVTMSLTSHNVVWLLIVHNLILVALTELVMVKKIS